MYVGEPPVRQDVPRGGALRVDPGTPLQSVNHGDEDLLMYVHGTPLRPSARSSSSQPSRRSRPRSESARGRRGFRASVAQAATRSASGRRRSAASWMAGGS
jgi:hypothetical protein